MPAIDGERMIALVLATMLTADTLSDNALVAYATQPYDKREKFNRQDVLGIHHGTKVVADFPCSDICPEYTVRIIHYAVAPGADCDKIGGVTEMRTVPFSIAVVRRPFCVPKILAEKKLD